MRKCNYCKQEKNENKFVNKYSTECSRCIRLKRDGGNIKRYAIVLKTVDDLIEKHQDNLDIEVDISESFLSDYLSALQFLQGRSFTKDEFVEEFYPKREIRVKARH